jgi:Protein of unknown function (DUF3253)
LSDHIEQLLREKILALLAARKPESSICPSDAPRALFTDWRNHMPTVREVALQMALEGLVEITQKHLPVNLEQFARGEVTGPIRLRLVGMAIG